MYYLVSSAYFFALGGARVTGKAIIASKIFSVDIFEEITTIINMKRLVLNRKSLKLELKTGAKLEKTHH